MKDQLSKSVKVPLLDTKLFQEHYRRVELKYLKRSTHFYASALAHLSITNIPKNPSVIRAIAK